MFLIVFAAFAAFMANAEVVIYYNDTYLTNGVIINATEVGEYSPCVFVPEITSFRPSNCISGTEQLFISDDDVAVRWLFDSTEQVWLWNGTDFNNPELLYTNTPEANALFSWRQFIITGVWTGSDRSGGQLLYNCENWSSDIGFGYTSDEFLMPCHLLQKLACVCLVDQGTIPGTTRSPTNSPTVPSRSPSRNPSKNPSKVPTKSPTNPTFVPTYSPSRNPTKVPTSGAAQCDCWIVFVAGMFVMWGFGGNKI